MLFVAQLEVLDCDLRVLKRGGYLASDDARLVTKEQFERALGNMLNAATQRLGLVAGSSSAKGSV